MKKFIIFLFVIAFGICAAQLNGQPTKAQITGGGTTAPSTITGQWPKVLSTTNQPVLNAATAYPLHFSSNCQSPDASELNKSFPTFPFNWCE